MAGSHQNQKNKCRLQHDAEVPLARMSTDITLEEKNWKYVCRLLEISSFKEGAM
jgi:hypothetical protein